MNDTKFIRQEYSHRYESKRRLASYWHQVDEVLRLGATRVLLVGCGTGTPEFMLRREGVDVVSLDVDASLSPSVVGSVTALAFREGEFEAAVCCQVLEHLPFESFPRALQELRRVSRRGVVISLPDQGRVLRFELKVPRLARGVLVDLPRLRPRRWSFDGQHHWEVNAAGFGVRAIERRFRDANLDVEATYRVFENPYHRFWRLRCV